MTLKNYEKFEEDLTCRFKIDMRNLTNFDPSTQTSQKKCTLIGSFCAKDTLFELKKHRGFILQDTKD